jgi:predicted nucleotidyltransferase
MKMQGCLLWISVLPERNPVPDLKALLQRLLEHKIDFVLIGGFAGTVHGITLVTQDLDICVAITEGEVAKLREALKDIHPKHRMDPSFKPSFLDYPKDLTGVNNIYLETDLGVLDILSSSEPAGDFKEIKSRSVQITLYGHKCNVISIDDLIKIKESMKRPKDLQAVEELKLIRDRKKS